MTFESFRRGALVPIIGLLLSAGSAQGLCGNAGGDVLCAGDCDLSRSVTVDEIVTTVNIALGEALVSVCELADVDGSSSITVDEIILSVSRALDGCGGGAAALEPGEECDDGGLCVGGANAGDPCSAETDCVGDGACFGGLDNLVSCDGDDDCREGICRKCRPYGGDGCAANCTLETDRTFAFVPGQIAPPGNEIVLGTSGSVIFGPFLTVPLPFTGAQALTVGKVVEGEAPVVLKTSGVQLDRIPVASIACACVRAATGMTCGGTLIDADSAPSANCTPDFMGAMECPAEKKCAPVHGPGNSGSGFIACGVPGVIVDFYQECRGVGGTLPRDPVVTVTRSTEQISSDKGSGYIAISSAIGTVVGSCTGSTIDYGEDGMFCTDDDPIEGRGTPGTIPFTTNEAQGIVVDPTIFHDVAPEPYTTTGSPFTCSGDAVSVSGANLAGAFTLCDQPTVSDIVVVTNFAAQ